MRAAASPGGDLRRRDRRHHRLVPAVDRHALEELGALRGCGVRARGGSRRGPRARAARATAARRGAAPGASALASALRATTSPWWSSATAGSGNPASTASISGSTAARPARWLRKAGGATSRVAGAISAASAISRKPLPRPARQRRRSPTGRPNTQRRRRQQQPHAAQVEQPAAGSCAVGIVGRRHHGGVIAVS